MLHPKMERVKQLLSEFFGNQDTSDRKGKALIFTQNRSSAAEITQELAKDPLIKPSVFMGKSGGFKKGPRESSNSNSNPQWDQKKAAADA